ncbi:sulfotransferase [Actinopolymorpha alba]|uniref:sulfotransferase n=1 Tax=Actinopolymorpha alba TaxID=533267 RepID=UPI0003724361|nr:sulfotransferase [Actinopolymorpha alba]
MRSPAPWIRRTFRSTARKVAARTFVTVPVCRLLDSPRADRPLRDVVVVTGPHRSGTTIMGHLLAQAARTFLVHEPFNLDWGLAGVPVRYPYLTAADVDAPAARVLRAFLRTGNGQWKGHGQPLDPAHPRTRTHRRNVRARRPFRQVAVVKDPFLVLALGWINQALSDRPPIVTLRHPGAWTASLLRRSMHPRPALAAFREQDAFGDPVVANILRQCEWERADLVPAAAATWACLVRMLDVQLRAGVRATVVRMEDFASDPHGVMVGAYGSCGLGVPPDLDQILSEYTGAHNVVVPERPVLHELRRHSAALADAWRTRLSEEEQKTIRHITEPVAKRWYDVW